MTKSRTQRATLAPLAATAAATALLLAGCGDSGSGGGSSTIKPGGTLTGYFSEAPDSLDPALASTANAQTAIYAAYTPLLVYKRADGAEGGKLEPGVAEALPEVSDDGKTYTLKVREGLTYSDGSPVKASDFERTVQRILNLQSFGAGYFTGIDGAQEYADGKKATADIAGIETDDATRRITIRLTDADPQFPYKLGLVYGGIVPGDTPFEDLTKTPPPGVGPFAITGVERSAKAFSFVKAKTFKALPSVPTANADRIDVTVVDNQRRQAQDVLGNRVDFINDPPPADQLRILREQAKDRYREYTTNSTYYFVLNVDAKPFDQPEVRKAVAIAVNEGALARLYGGLMAPDCNFLPPGIIGYEKLDPCPSGEPTAAPDIARAKDMIAEAGAAGKKVTVWSDDSDGAAGSAEYLADLLTQLGMDASPKSLKQDPFYESVSDRSTKAQVISFNWFQDYPHPASFFANVNGANITPEFNVDLGNTNDPELNAKIDAGDAKPNVSDAVGDYAEADRLLVDRAYVVPYGHRKLPVITSNRVAFDRIVFSPVYSLDLASLGLKAAE